MSAPTDSYAQQLDVDAMVIGGGFGGIYNLWKLRKQGLNVKMYEAAADLGGVWRWNCYPGARVDVEMPYYQLNIPEVWNTWTWSVRFPEYSELRRYFKHVAEVLDLRKDIAFKTEVTSASFNEETGRWTVKTRDGRSATCKYLVNCVGTSFKRHFPNIDGLHDYEGPMHHSSFWPEEGVDVKGKNVAIIGSGATGLQIAQEWAKEAGHLTVFIRTPNLTLPMYQRALSEPEQRTSKGIYEALFNHCRTTRSGLPYSRCKKASIFDMPEEERQEYLEMLWARGGFTWSQGLPMDFLTSQEANDYIYAFWAKKTRARVTDPVKRDILAPLKKPHPYLTKRASLEQDYYEMMDRDNVTLIDLGKTPMKQFEKNGIRTSDGTLHQFDAIALGTGYDAVTGGLNDMGLTDTSGINLKDRWSQGVFTYIGLTVTGFPNMFIVYGPQAPTAFTNGPIFIQVQGDWISNMIDKMEKNGYKTVEPTKDAELKWRNTCIELNDKTLFPLTNSWYNGGNIPGKLKEALNYIGGIDNYEKALLKSLDSNDFVYKKEDSKPAAGARS